ncbi:MAG: conjugal transfer protein TraF [Cyclobacteriaceae bacterium]
MTKATFYHAGCPVCVSAEQDILRMVDRSKWTLDIVHLGEDQSRIAEAEKLGVKSVPALVLDNENVLHLNFGASMDAVKG